MLALNADPGHPTRQDHLARLEETFKTERRLLEDLAGVLAMQRTGVAGDDLSAVDDSVFAAQRILRTLAEARSRHRILLELLVEQRDLPLGEVEEALGGDMTIGLRTALHELQDAARRLTAELDQNRRILQGALDAGSRLLDALGRGGRAPVVYGAPGTSASPGGSLLVDRQV